MNGAGAHRIAQIAGFAFLVLIAASASSAQQVIGAKAGLVSFFEGEVSVEGRPAGLTNGTYYVQLENGQSLRTGQGRVEVLLNPSVYLRMSDDALLHMQQNRLKDVQLAIERGSALIEIVEEIRGSTLAVRFCEVIAEFKKAGLYRFDTTSGSIRVYAGEALVQKRNKKIKMGPGRMVHASGDLTSTNFDEDAADALHKWAGQRSFDLFMATESSRKQTHWQFTSLGWMRNQDFRMNLYSSLSLALWQEQQRQEAFEKWKETIPVSMQPSETPPRR